MNTKVRKIIDNFDPLVDAILPENTPEHTKDLWYKSLNSYRELMVMVRQREDFSDKDIEEFSDLCVMTFTRTGLSCTREKVLQITYTWSDRVMWHIT